MSGQRIINGLTEAVALVRRDTQVTGVLFHIGREIGHDEARDIACRLIAGSFRRDGERLDGRRCPRFSIPTRPGHDDDCLILAYIEQCEAEITRLRKIESLHAERLPSRARSTQQPAEDVDWRDMPEAP